jgi:hypothetical protein
MTAGAKLLHDCARVFEASGEDAVLDGLGFVLDIVKDGCEGVDDLVDEGVTDPVGGEVDVITQTTDTLAHVGGVRVLAEREGEEAFPEHHGVDVDGLEVVLALLVEGVEGSEAKEVVGLEKLNLLTGLLGCDILASQRVDTECAANRKDLLLRRVEHVEPPNASFRTKLEDVTESLIWHEQATQFRSVDGLVNFRGEESESVLKLRVAGDPLNVLR